MMHDLHFNLSYGKEIKDIIENFAEKGLIV